MEQNNEPEALDVANQLEKGLITLGKTARALRYEAAEAIRHLHARVQELEAELESIGAGGVSAQRVTQAKDHIEQDLKMVAVEEPFGYFKAEPFGWRDCAETDEGAIALYEAPQPLADALDTERLDWLIEQGRSNGVVYEFDKSFWMAWLDGYDAHKDEHQIGRYHTAREAIDAAIAAAKENK